MGQAARGMQHLRGVAGWAAADAAVHAAVATALGRWPGLRDRLRLVRLATDYPMQLLPVYFGARGAWALRASPLTRTFGRHPDAERFMHVYVAHNLLATLFELRAAAAPAPGALRAAAPLLAHHLGSSAAYALALRTGHLHFWACAAGLCEVTNVFLTTHQLAQTADLRAWAARRARPVLLANGGMLWLSFLLFRVLLFPAWLRGFWADAGALPPAERARIRPAERAYYTAVVLMLFGLSCGWFAKITRGLAGALRRPAA